MLPARAGRAWSRPDSRYAGRQSEVAQDTIAPRELFPRQPAGISAVATRHESCSVANRPTPAPTRRWPRWEHSAQRPCWIRSCLRASPKAVFQRLQHLVHRPLAGSNSLPLAFALVALRPSCHCGLRHVSLLWYLVSFPVKRMFLCFFLLRNDSHRVRRDTPGCVARWKDQAEATTDVKYSKRQRTRFQIARVVLFHPKDTARWEASSVLIRFRLGNVLLHNVLHVHVAQRPEQQSCQMTVASQTKRTVATTRIDDIVLFSSGHGRASPRPQQQARHRRRCLFAGARDHRGSNNVVVACRLETAGALDKVACTVLAEADSAPTTVSPAGESTAFPALGQRQWPVEHQCGILLCLILKREIKTGPRHTKAGNTKKDLWFFPGEEAVAASGSTINCIDS